MPKKPPQRIELLQGTLDMLILRTLVFGPAHGHQIAKHLQRTTDDLLQVEHGSLYPALHRLERKGSIAAKWERAGKDLKREFKYYRLTQAGKRQLTVEESDGSRWAGGLCARNVACRGSLTCIGGGVFLTSCSACFSVKCPPSKVTPAARTSEAVTPHRSHAIGTGTLVLFSRFSDYTRKCKAIAIESTGCREIYLGSVCVTRKRLQLHLIDPWCRYDCIFP